jgi:hypothetical protein
MPDISSRWSRRSGPVWLGPIAVRFTPTVKAFVIADVSIYLFYVLVR